jgi:hypothetical protein
MPEPLGGWIVVVGQFGWLFDGYAEALDEARHLAAWFHLAIRKVSS